MALDHEPQYGPCVWVGGVIGAGIGLIAGASAGAAGGVVSCIIAALLAVVIGGFIGVSAGGGLEWLLKLMSDDYYDDQGN